MSEIKSAYEKAMERFQDVKADKTSLQKEEAIKKGKALCAKALDDASIVVKDEIDKVDDSQREWFRDGIGETLLAQVVLPSSEVAMTKIDTINKIAILLHLLHLCLV